MHINTGLGTRTDKPLEVTYLNEQWREGLSQGKGPNEVDFVELADIVYLFVQDRHEVISGGIVDEEIKSAPRGLGYSIPSRLDVGCFGDVQRDGGDVLEAF
jgi:hypothetical protein